MASFAHTLATLQTTTSHKRLKRCMRCLASTRTSLHGQSAWLKSTCSSRVVICAVWQSRSETIGTDAPRHPSLDASPVAIIVSLRDLASSWSWLHPSSWKLRCGRVCRSNLRLRPSPILLGIRETEHRVLISESSMPFKFATKRQKM